MRTLSKFFVRNGGIAGCRIGPAVVSLVLATAAPSVASTVPDESARTTHFFPLVADGDGFRSRLFVTDVSDAPNYCRLELQGPSLDIGFFQADAAVTRASTNVTIDLDKAGGSVTLASVGGQGLAFGYAKLECAEPAVARVLLSLENGGTPLSLATLESASAGASFQFPVLPRLGRLALVFSSEARLATACAVELEDETGASLGGGDVAIPAESTALQFLDELVPVPDGFRAGKARISCNRDVAALGIPLNGLVFTALSATMLDDETAGGSHILPLIQDGGGFRSRLLLTSLAETANRCTVDLYGSGLEASRFEIPADAAASGSNISLEFAGKGDQASLFSMGTGGLAYGYAAVECDRPVEARNLLTVDVAGGLVGMAAISSAWPADGMEFPVVPALGRLTLAMNNEGESEASCAIELTVNGDTVSSTGLFQVPGRSTLLRFLGDLFALPDDFSGGMANLSCYSEVSAASLLVSDPVFAVMPAVVVPIRTNPESARTIPDDNLRLLIFQQLDKAPGALVGPEELSELRSLNARNAGIKSLEGLQHATGLTSLDLGPAPWDPENGHVNSNRVTDLSPILGLSNLQTLDLSNNELSGPIPAELGQLGNLRFLDLSGNRLSGDIPGELGQLSALESLDLGGNELSGSFPHTFLQLDRLHNFYFSGNEDLCVAGVSAFVAWLNDIENRSESDSFCNEADRKALEYLFERVAGAGWSKSDGWAGSPALDEWHGVRTDSLGHVTALDLEQNGLSGKLPANLVNLTRMTELKVGGNPDLHGRFPLSFADLSVQTLHYANTGLCAPADAIFRDWLDAVPSHEGTGEECARPSDREVLEILYGVTDGLNWTHDENWHTDAPLENWRGVGVDGQGRVIEIEFYDNDLAGRIPRELGDLSQLRLLYLSGNRLTGPIPADLADLADLEQLLLDGNDVTGAIPPELGNLANLQRLWLGRNDFTGAIPPELGNLTDLWSLDLSFNRLAGRIPPELGGLVNLESLFLGENDLTGAIPPELGNLADLQSLDLSSNRLTGHIPPELGGLVNLESLFLGENEFTGSLPPSLWNLTRLRTLALQSNSGISGTLPAVLANLVALETLQVEGTGLCAPSGAGFLEWLEGVAIRRVVFCEGEPAMAYLVQAVQSRQFPVPLVAGEDALLRVFVTADSENSGNLPPVRTSFYRNGALAHIVDIPAAPGPIPTEVAEGSLTASINTAIPADVIQPGLEMVVEVDPDGTLDAALGAARRIPATGRMAVDVRVMPTLDLTLVPFLWTEDPDSDILDSVTGMAADPGHELLELARKLLPVGNLTVTAHEPVFSSSNEKFDLLSETDAIRIMEGAAGHYMGMMSGIKAGGVASLGGKISYSGPDARVIAHELGHNFGLPHAPCGGAGGPDAAYPHADGTTGAWGYDFDGGGLVSSDRFDLMSYCDPAWIGDYNFTKAFHYRVEDEGSEEASPMAKAVSSLLLWGGADSKGIPHLNPAFVVDAAPVLPDYDGAFRVTGRTAAGEVLFVFGFSMPNLADGDGSSSFAFALPVEPDWGGRLASITLTGPGGSAILDADSDQPMAILRSPQTGRVLGILRDSRFAPQAVAASAAGGRDPGALVESGGTPASGATGAAEGQSLEILFSRGIPDAEVWRH